MLSGVSVLFGDSNGVTDNAPPALMIALDMFGASGSSFLVESAVATV